MTDYKTIQIAAKNVKPGDIINRKNELYTVAKIVQTATSVIIETTAHRVWLYKPEQDVLKEISPAEEAEEGYTNHEVELDRLDNQAADRAHTILGLLEPYIPILIKIKEHDTIIGTNFEGLYTIDEDFKKAAEEAINLAEHIGDYTALYEDMIGVPMAADEGPHGRNK